MIKNMKGYEKFIKEKQLAPSIADAIGGEAAKELTEAIRSVDPETTWVDVLNNLKKNHKISEFQAGMLLGFFSAYQAISENGLTVGELNER
jgi:hypothetical protein